MPGEKDSEIRNERGKEKRKFFDSYIFCISQGFQLIETNDRNSNRACVGVRKYV